MRSYHPIVFGYLVAPRASLSGNVSVAKQNDRQGGGCNVGSRGAFSGSLALGVVPDSEGDSLRGITPAT